MAGVDTNFVPIEIANALSNLIPNSRYKKYGSCRALVYIPGSLLRGDTILAILKGSGKYTNKIWRTTVQIEFEDKKLLENPRIKEFLQREAKILEEQGGVLEFY